MARPEGSNQSWFDTLREVATPLIGELAEKAVEALPVCSYCESRAIPLRCVICGSFACKDHGYHSLGRREAVCRQCLLDLLGAAGGPGQVSQSPWEVLGVPEGSNEKQINRAFRLKALKCHPDHYPDDPEKLREYRRITWAREVALESAKAQR